MSYKISNLIMYLQDIEDCHGDLEMVFQLTAGTYALKFNTGRFELCTVGPSGRNTELGLRTIQQNPDLPPNALAFVL